MSRAPLLNIDGAKSQQAINDYKNAVIGIFQAAYAYRMESAVVLQAVNGLIPASTQEVTIRDCTFTSGEDAEHGDAA
jgi:hypothetical protein